LENGILPFIAELSQRPPATRFELLLGDFNLEGHQLEVMWNNGWKEEVFSDMATSRGGRIDHAFVHGPSCKVVVIITTIAKAFSDHAVVLVQVKGERELTENAKKPSVAATKDDTLAKKKPSSVSTVASVLSGMRLFSGKKG
jgi:hypothetical protein